MNKEEVILKTADFIRNKFEGEGSGHDWEHIKIVWETAKEIAVTEPKADLFVVELGALLHDIADWKENNGDTMVGAKAAAEWLSGCGLEMIIVDKVAQIVGGVSFTGINAKERALSLEGLIVRDADRLEAIGERGVERTVKFGEKHGQPMIDGYMPNLEISEDEYKNFKREGKTVVNHFFEKLLFLKKGLYTKKAKEIGQKKHEYMKNYLRMLFANLPDDSDAKKNVPEYLNLLSSEIYD